MVPSHKLAMTKLIHENCSIIMTYAFSQPVLSKLLRQMFQGEWKYFRKMLFDVSEERANRALLELAIQLRLLDDKERIAPCFDRGENSLKFGRVFAQDGSMKSMRFRDTTNKILHSSGFDWDFSNDISPKVICHPSDADRWLKAEIDVLNLGVACGELMS